MSEKALPPENFFEMLKAWLASLPTDIKILIDMIGDDQLKMEARTLAAGTTFYILAPIDLIPERVPILGYLDDAIILHIALVIIVQIDPVRGDYYREKHPQTFEALNRQIELLEKTLGALFSWLKALVESLAKRRYRRQSPEDVIASERSQEDLFDAAMEYAADINVDTVAIERALVGAPPDRIIGLLSQGLEEEQRRQLQEGKEGMMKSLSDASNNFRKLLSRREGPKATDSTGLLPAGRG